MRLIAWLLRGFIFFTLFAFALNNQQVVTVHWFFGVDWNARLVIVVLAAFAAGCALGALAMVPSWWRQRQQVRRLMPPDGGPAAGPAAGTAVGPGAARNTGFGGLGPTASSSDSAARPAAKSGQSDIQAGDSTLPHPPRIGP
jgi:lipopolysaccharide assembly protein A